MIPRKGTADPLSVGLFDSQVIEISQVFGVLTLTRAFASVARHAVGGTHLDLSD